MIPAVPSRKDSPVVNQFAKPIPLTQSFENAATTLDDIPKEIDGSAFACNPREGSVRRMARMIPAVPSRKYSLLSIFLQNPFQGRSPLRTHQPLWMTFP